MVARLMLFGARPDRIEDKPETSNLIKIEIQKEAMKNER